MNNFDKKRKKIDELLKRGVRIPCPESVEIGPEVIPERISGNGVVIHSGCKLYGSDTFIMDGVRLGYEAPVTINDCLLGRDVKLEGGFFDRSVFLNGASIGSGAQVREGCLLEESARCAHSVGLKHTILFPFVTLGSQINFCDCLMAGGTDSKNHSEVGSSFIHFNYTPNQDKATPSLIGDVPRGVMVNQPPIFLGGQGGLVGPVIIEYGTVTAAGVIARKDILEGNTILLGNKALPKTVNYHSGLFTNIKRIVKLNSTYISNLIALRRYYLDVRTKFFCINNQDSELYEGAVKTIETAIKERMKRLGDIAKRMSRSIEIYMEISGGHISENLVSGKKEFETNWHNIEHTFLESFDNAGDQASCERFLNIIREKVERDGKDYLRVIKGLGKEESRICTMWLQGIVDEICNRIWSLMPGLNIK